MKQKGSADQLHLINWSLAYVTIFLKADVLSFCWLGVLKGVLKKTGFVTEIFISVLRISMRYLQIQNSSEKDDVFGFMEQAVGS